MVPTCAPLRYQVLVHIQVIIVHLLANHFIMGFSLQDLDRDPDLDARHGYFGSWSSVKFMMKDETTESSVHEADCDPKKLKAPYHKSFVENFFDNTCQAQGCVIRLIINLFLFHG